MFSKVLVFCIFLGAAHASVLLSPLVNTGISTSTRKQDAIGNYAFSYGIGSGHGSTNSRAEVGDAHGNKRGSYTITDVDGRARRVDYVADGLGFRASVKTNEPGTALSAPAAAAIASPYAGPVAPVAAAAPIVSVAAAPVVATSSVIGHGAALASPLGLGLSHLASPLGLGLSPLASPLGLGLSPLGLGLGAPISKSILL